MDNCIGLDISKESINVNISKNSKDLHIEKRVKGYEDIVYSGISRIAKYFDKLWIRTSDIRTDEYMNLKGAPQEKEGIPMLGMHGIRDSLLHPEILKAELNIF